MDPGRPLAPGVTLFVHLSEAALGGSDPLARVAVKGVRGGGGVLRTQLAQAVADWCGRDGAEVTVQPVIDLNVHRDSAAEEPTAGLRTRTGLRRDTCVFPWCERPAVACDADHHIPAGQGGPSCDCNLHPLCRRHHRLKTFAGWSYTPLETSPPDRGGGPPDPDHPGPATSWLWRSPHGMAYLVDEHGTRDVTP